MSSADDLFFQEFYISCNPPLLPAAVGEVIASSKAKLQDKLLEMLYEPEVPWFKLISNSTHRDEVSQFIQSELIAIGENEASDLDAENDAINDNERGDVTIVEGSQRMVSWMIYDNNHAALIDAFDEFRFPDIMASTPYKTIWRCPIDDIEDVLRTSAQSWFGSEVPLILDDMGEQFGCQLSYNHQKTVLYIGSDESMEIVQKAVRKLDGMVYAMNFASKLSPTNFIAIEGETNIKIAYRWLSHLALDKITYQFDLSSPGPLCGAALRTAVDIGQGEGRWRVDTTSYPLRESDKPNPPKRFNIFANYEYRQKKSYAEFDRVPGMKPAPPDIKNTDSGQAKPVSRGVPWTAGIPASATDCQVAKWVEGVQRANIDSVPSEEPQLSDTETPNTTGALTPAPHGTLLIGDNKAQEELPEDLMEFESNSSQPKTPVRKTSTRCLLESETPDREGALLEYEALTSRDYSCGTAKDDIHSTGEPYDLMDSTDPVPSIPDFEPLGFLRGYATVNPQELGNRSIIHDLSLFGIEEDKPKELHQTMNQRAGNKTKSPSKNSIQNVPQRDPQNHGTGDAGISQPRPASSDVVRGRSAGQSVEYYKSVKVKKTSPAKQVEPVHPLPALAKTIEGLRWPHLKNNFDLRGNSSQLVKTISARMKEMVGILQLVPGKVKLELKFGRLWFSGLSETDIHSDSSPQLWDITEIQRYLDDMAAHDSSHRVIFQSILTSCGEDAEKLSQLRAPGEPRWEAPHTKVSYDFFCSYTEGNRTATRFKVVVDAETFEHVCLGLDEELSNISVHCPLYAWDVKVCATRARSAGFPVECEKFAKLLVESLGVMTKKTGDITIEVAQPKGRGIIIENAEVRHVAQYKSKASSNSSLLTITMTRPLANDIDYRKDPSTFRCSSYSATVPGQSAHAEPGKPNKLGEWFEMSLSSWRAEEMFQENAGMEFGQRASWTTDMLDDEGVFRDICHSALSLVSKMDGIGLANNNGLATAVGRAYRAGASTLRSGLRKYEYW